MAIPLALVIGGGFGGIAAALRLRARGFRVQLMERQSRLGGRASVLSQQGVIFDTGPTVITAPFLLEELFALFQIPLADRVTLQPVTPWYRFQFHHGATFDYSGDLDHTRAEIARFNPPDCEGYQKLLNHAQELFDVGFLQLGHQPFHRFSTLLQQVPTLWRLEGYRSVYSLVTRYIQHPDLRKLLSIQPLLIGGNPLTTPAIYLLIHALERQWGVHWVKGGIHKLIDVLTDLLQEVGVDIQFNQTVTEIGIEQERVTSVRLASGQQVKADIVVVNADPAYTYQNMMPPRYRSNLLNRLTKADYSSGLFVVYFSTRHRYKNVAHHTILLGQRYRELLADIFKRRVLAQDFSVYVHHPTATEPDLVPTNVDQFYALVPVPNLQSDIDWLQTGPLFQRQVLDHLAATLLPNLHEHLTDVTHITPLDFQSRWLSPWGCGFSIAPTLLQSAYFRFHNRSPIQHLYFVGAGTHPGAGVPGVLCSAKVLDALVPTASQWVP